MYAQTINKKKHIMFVPYETNPNEWSIKAFTPLPNMYTTDNFSWAEKHNIMQMPKCSATMEKILTEFNAQAWVPLINQTLKTHLRYLALKTYFLRDLEDNLDNSEFKQNLLHIFATNGVFNLDDEAERENMLKFLSNEEKTLWNTIWNFYLQSISKSDFKKSEESDILSAFMMNIDEDTMKILKDIALGIEADNSEEAHKKMESMIEKDFEKYNVGKDLLSFENCRFLRKLGRKYSNKEVEYIDMFMQEAKIEQQKYNSEIKPILAGGEKAVEVFCFTKAFEYFAVSSEQLKSLEKAAFKKKAADDKPKYLDYLEKFWQLTNVHTFKETLANLNIEIEVVDQVVKIFEEVLPKHKFEEIGSGRGGNDGNGRGGNGGGGGPRYSSKAAKRQAAKNNRITRTGGNGKPHRRLDDGWGNPDHNPDCDSPPC